MIVLLFDQKRRSNQMYSIAQNLYTGSILITHYYWLPKLSIFFAIIGLALMKNDGEQMNDDVVVPEFC